MQVKTFGNGFKIKSKNFDLKLMLSRLIMVIRLMQKATDLLSSKIKNELQRTKTQFELQKTMIITIILIIQHHKI